MKAAPKMSHRILLIDDEESVREFLGLMLEEEGYQIDLAENGEQGIAKLTETEFDLIHGTGVCLAGEIVDLGVEAKLIGKRGSWYSLGTESIGQGREAAMRHLLEHPQMMEQLRVELLASAGIGVRPEDEAEDGGIGGGDGEGDAGAKGEGGTKGKVEVETAADVAKAA